MEVRSTSSASGAQGPESARFLIDQGELRSILSNLSHELCRPLVSLRAGFDLLLGESPSTISQDQRGHLPPWSRSATTCCGSPAAILTTRAIVQGSRPALPRLIHDRGPDRRNRPPVRPDRFGPPDRLGIALLTLPESRGDHRRHHAASRSLAISSRTP